MAEATTKTTAAKSRATKTSKPAAANPFADFDAFSFPTMEVPEAFRSMAEKGVQQAKDTYAQLKENAEEATDLLEDSYEMARKNTLDFNEKTIDAVKDNVDATFSFFKDFAGVKSLSEAIELQSAFARSRFQAATDQAKDMQDFTTKIVEDASLPFKEATSKVMKQMKTA